MSVLRHACTAKYPFELSAVVLAAALALCASALCDRHFAQPFSRELAIGDVVSFSLVDYDAAGRTVRRTESTGAVTEYEYGYSVYGQMLSVRDPLERETQFAYDHLNRPTGRTLPLGQSENMEYDAYGRLSRRTDFKGQVTEFAYDSLGRVAARHLYAAGSDAPDEIQAYDNLNRLVRETLAVPGAGAGYEAEYDYDLAGNRLVRRVRAGGELLTTRYSYDDNDRLVREDSTVALAALAVAPDGTLLAANSLLPNAHVTV